MRKRLLILITLALVAGAGFMLTERQVTGSAVTFTKDVAPILYKSCAECHRPTGVAPMSLLNYKEVRPWARSIKERVADRTMPPWFADPKHGEFANKQLLPHLEAAARAGDPARVINIGSIDGIQIPFVDNYTYSASKAAVHHLTRVLAVKLGPRGVAVNAVAPGFFPSKMTEWLMDNFEEQIVAGCPLRRKGAPADMAGVAIYLASRAGAYVNGAVITVDGGTCLK
jgi:NAD(P)-dependent dehydrogenase (short-subunit alcohol dehydrogenase family)